MLANHLDSIYSVIKDPILKAYLTALERDTTSERIQGLAEAVLQQMWSMAECAISIRKLAFEIEHIPCQEQALENVNTAYTVFKKIFFFLSPHSSDAAKACLNALKPIKIALDRRDWQQLAHCHTQKIIDVFEKIPAAASPSPEWNFLKNNLTHITTYIQRNLIDLKFQLCNAVKQHCPLMRFSIPLPSLNFVQLDFIYYLDSQEIIFMSKLLDRGSSRDAWLACNLSCKQMCVVSEQKINWEDEIKYILREKSILEMLKQKAYVLQMLRLDICQERPRVSYLITENCDMGKLSLHLKTLNQAQKLKISCEIIKGIEEIHRIEHVHRDIKPDNIFLKTVDGQIQAVIADLGFACPITCKTLSKIRGTPFYLPLEVLKRQTLHNYLSDAWSVGVVLSRLFNGCYPFDSEVDRMRDFIKVLEQLTLPKPDSNGSIDYTIWALLQPEALRFPLKKALSVLENIAFKLL